MTSTQQRVFVGTNVLIYLLSAQNNKADIAQRILKARPVISVQVLNETANVMSRKLNSSAKEIADFLQIVRANCEVVDLTQTHTDVALSVLGKHQLGYFDSLIIAAALLADCSKLLTEDLQHGMVIARQLKIVDPFR